MSSRHVRCGLAALALAIGTIACRGNSGNARVTKLVAVTTGPIVPYKLGTFDREGRTFIGLVLRETQVVDIALANSSLEQGNDALPKLTLPSDLKTLIAVYGEVWADRLEALARAVPANAPTPLAYPLDVVKVLPPVRPGIILNAGGNYTEHTAGIAAQQRRSGAAVAPDVRATSAPGIWERSASDTRDNPYLFIKSPTVITGAFDPIVMPRWRTNIDFECEFDVVVGKTAKYVPINKAADYIFGYTVQIDVSDRGGRGDRKMGGSDWLIGKNHDTFGPIGPFIVPKAFVKDPMNIRHTFMLSGEVMQDSNTSRMDHNIYELLHYASNILTLNPGDIISGGSPAGTNIERAQPRWMHAGDTAQCNVEGIGTQKHTVVAEVSS
jgi:2-keto-4-pentenoate hydratase/2-oxohepta-3-ene-1,7-dioic acid hydratase in catechol pathway